MDLQVISILNDEALLEKYVETKIQLNSTVAFGGRVYRRLCDDEQKMRYEILRRMGGK